MHQKAMCMIASRLLNKTLFQHRTMQSFIGRTKKDTVAVNPLVI